MYPKNGLKTRHKPIVGVSLKPQIKLMQCRYLGAVPLVACAVCWHEHQELLRLKGFETRAACKGANEAIDKDNGKCYIMGEE